MPEPKVNWQHPLATGALALCVIATAVSSPVIRCCLSVLCYPNCPVHAATAAAETDEIVVEAASSTASGSSPA